MIAAVIGCPISHSLSPKLFSFIANSENLEIDYQALEVNTKDATKFFEDFKKNKKLVGVNVTIPLKECFLDKIDKCSPEVKIIGALNVLHLKDDKVYGHNTDVVGIEATLADMSFDIALKDCLILGAGGGAKATAYVLGFHHAKNVYVYNLSPKNESLVKHFESHFPETSWHILNPESSVLNNSLSFDLVVNTTPVGMTGKDNELGIFNVLTQFNYKKSSLAFDLIYTPAETKFMKQMSKLDVKTVGGLSMFINQALGTWKIWQGKISDELKLKNDLAIFLSGILALKQESTPIYLTGLMGAGKSQVGQMLASVIGREFIDTDSYIENKLGKSINEIFSLMGETQFRDIERDSISELIKESNHKKLIISLGGGSLINQESLNTILNSKGHLVYLMASPEVLNERILIHENKTNSVRPILKGLDNISRLNKLTELLNNRQDNYKKASIHIQTNDLDTQGVTFEILKAFGQVKSSETLNLERHV